MDNEVTSADGVASRPLEMSRGISAELTVNDVLLRYPASAPVFNAFGIDACCGGATTLASAAGRDGADLERPMSALDEAIGGGVADVRTSAR